MAREANADHPAAARIEFREGPAEDLPVGDGDADVVLAFDSFDHWQDSAQGLGEIRRVLRPQGRLVVVKDGGLPGGAKARQTFVDALLDAGFSVAKEEEVAAEGVCFTLWVCEVDA